MSKRKFKRRNLNANSNIKYIKELPIQLLKKCGVIGGLKDLFIELWGHCGAGFSCMPSQETLGSEIGKSIRQVQRYLRALVKLGLILVVRRGITKTNIYILKVKESFQNSLRSEKNNSSIANEDKSISTTSSEEKDNGVVENIKRKCTTYANKYKKTKESTFNSFKQRNYNFKSLQKMLTGEKEYNPEELYI